MSGDRELSTADIARGRSDETEEPSREEMTREDAVRADADEATEPREPLFAEQESSTFRDRWHQVQAAFVDEPRDAVAQADALVAELMQRLADTFAQERSKLEGQWDSGDDVSTEDLRVALQRYRSFFDRLLTA